MKNKFHFSKKVIILFTILGVLFLLNGVVLPLFYLSYMNRSRYTFSDVLRITKKSPILNQKLGYIQEVKPDNFMKWISKKKGKDCLKVSIKSEKGNYKACVIIKMNHKDEFNDIQVQGYFVGDKKYTDAS